MADADHADATQSERSSVSNCNSDSETEIGSAIEESEDSEASEQSDSDAEDDVGLLPISLLQGDWVAVKIGHDKKQVKGKSKMH
jgi:hypothetical protein